MKRYPVVLGATAAGLAGVLTFHTHAPSSTPPPAAPHHSQPSTSPHSSSPPPTRPSGQASARVAGVVEQYGYGQLSVQVSFSGTKITAIKVATLQTADQYSQQLADQVIPILEREILSAQSAHVQAISGATYTSDAYALSVQSAIDHRP